jgi:riboflavin synthase
MFTGIIEETGIIDSVRRERDSARISIRAQKVLEATAEGDSIAVNGVCLTATDIRNGTFSADISNETLMKSSLATIRTGNAVNLERAATLQTRLGGHLVQGHVDGTGRISRIAKRGLSRVMTIECPPRLLKYIVDKGSIAVDGVSLTACDPDRNSFSVSLIPHTSHHSTLDGMRAGDTVNIECDAIAKHLEKLIQVEAKK